MNDDCCNHLCPGLLKSSPYSTFVNQNGKHLIFLIKPHDTDKEDFITHFIYQKNFQGQFASGVPTVFVQLIRR